MTYGTEKYVVIEYNQASGHPRLYSDDIYLALGEALDVANEGYAQNRKTGRRERYEVQELFNVWPNEDYE